MYLVSKEDQVVILLASLPCSHAIPISICLPVTALEARVDGAKIKSCSAGSFISTRSKTYLQPLNAQSYGS